MFFYGLLVSLLVAVHFYVLLTVEFVGLSGIPGPLASRDQLAILAESVVVHSLYCGFQLRRRGYISTSQLAGWSSAVIVGSVLLGSAATYVGMSWLADKTTSGVVKAVNTPR